MVTADLISSIPLFSTLPKAQLSLLADCASARNYPRGSVILRAGQETDGLYIMLSGRAKVFMSNEDGREVILATLGARDFFGEMGLLDEQPRSASVETLEDSSLMRIGKADFLRCLSDNFDLAMRILLALVKRLRESDRQIESLALMDVYGRVARVLLDHAQPVDGQYVIANPPLKMEIARMIGASREMVSRVMKDLQQAGHIQVDKRRIVLFDRLGSRRRGAN